ncbi:MAG: DegT/DnrJ/EryC1/StrS family aminotransferase [Spirochaetales bacterium]|nr:DegT/DnrJ/EryC1/StrS family aminotransferase [Spirochaetales bacterium]
MNLSTDTIPFARPCLGPEEEEAVLRVMRSGWLTTGAEALAFEKEFALYTGAPHALAVNSATAGLHLAVEALGIGPGDTVLVPTFTFTSTAEVVRYCGGDPVFVDLAPGSFNMDPADCEKKILALKASGREPRGIITVHIAGDTDNFIRIRELSLKYGLFLVEDAAHAFPVETADGMAGTLSDAGVYSFYANKTITTGEGGMIVTSREDLKERISAMRLHGINRAVWNRYTDSSASWEYDIVAPGFKYNMSDMAAAVGRIQLKRAAEFLEKRIEAVRLYLEILGGSSVSELLELPRWKEDHSWHLFMIRLSTEKLTISRNGFIDVLKERGIGTSVHYKPLHMMSYYAEHYALAPEDFPAAMDCYSRVLSLPLFPGLTEQQIRRICTVVGEVLEKHRK